MMRGWLQVRRWLLARRRFDEPLCTLLRQEPPAPRTAIADVEFVILDIETTGPDAATAEMLSVGWVLMQHGRVRLETATSFLVRPRGEVGDSASVHGLTDTKVESGRAWEGVLDDIIAALTGRVLVVHYAGLDKVLLDRLCRRRFGTALPVPVVDTLAIEQRRLQRAHRNPSRSQLQLAALRKHYGLPRYAAHDSLQDAVATAELLAAIVAHRGATTLGELLA